MSWTGEEVVQLYIGFENSGITRPVKLLRGFQKVKLQPGETRQLRFEINAGDLSWYNPEIKGWETEEMDYTVYIGSSSSPSDLSAASFRYGSSVQ